MKIGFIIENWHIILINWTYGVYKDYEVFNDTISGLRITIFFRLKNL